MVAVQNTIADYCGLLQLTLLPPSHQQMIFGQLAIVYKHTSLVDLVDHTFFFFYIYTQNYGQAL